MGFLNEGMNTEKRTYLQKIFVLHFDNGENKQWHIQPQAE